jgi:hypothetical protein
VRGGWELDAWFGFSCLVCLGVRWEGGTSLDAGWIPVRPAACPPRRRLSQLASYGMYRRRIEIGFVYPC